jgi:phosphatidylglycerophosphate synthase
MSRPTTAELRAVCQPASTIDRRNGEHWAGRWYMRRASIHVTKVFLRLGWSPNSITWLMIVTGVAAGPALLIPGIAGAVAAALLIQVYLLLDCCDGEVARWTGRTSTTGVYLDRVGHYFAEVSLMIGVGFRAADVTPTGYAVLGCLAAVGVALVKAETDLVVVARASGGLPSMEESAAEPRSAALGSARRFASMLKYHRIIGAVEASLLIVVASVIDATRGDLTATRFLVIAFVVVAGLQTVLHLVSVLASRRLE